MLSMNITVYIDININMSMNIIILVMIDERINSKSEPKTTARPSALPRLPFRHKI